MKLKSSILILALLVSMFAVAMPKPAISTPDNAFSLDPDPAVGNVGTVASIDVKIDAVSNLNGYEFDLIWDRKVLKYKGVTWGWLEDLPTYTTTKTTSVSTMGNELAVFEGFDDPEHTRSSVAPQTLATVSWDVIAGGETDINFTRHYLWTTNVVEIPSTADDGSLYTEQPYADFSWSPSGPRIGEVVTYDASASKATEMVTGDIGGGTSGDGVVDSTDLGILGAAWGSFEGPPADANWNVDCDFQRDGVIDSTDLGIMGAFWGQFGNYITGYTWTFDEVKTGKVVTKTYDSYSKTAHNITLVVTDSEGDNTTLSKMHTVNRDISMFSIWPSMEDYQGSIEFEFVSGKYVVILVRYANIGTITEYTNNIKGDFPATAEVQLYLIHSDGTEEKIYSTYDGRLRRYWNYTAGDTALTRLYDWAPLVGVSQWKFWDLWGAAPETDLHLKANFTDTATGNDPFIGDTDLANNELWFGPFNITAGSDHDIRLEGIWAYDAVGYYVPIQPYGTNYRYYYGGKFGFGGEGPYDPMPPGTIANVTVAMSNVGNYDETVTWHVYAGGTEIYTSTDVLDIATGYFEFTFEWNSTLFPGTYTVESYAEPVAGETGLWATWDNNTPENQATYGLRFFNAYDDWGFYSSHP
jgi:hypothetical protein